MDNPLTFSLKCKMILFVQSIDFIDGWDILELVNSKHVISFRFVFLPLCKLKLITPRGIILHRI